MSVFLRTTEIKPIEWHKLPHIKTGLQQLDKKILGLFPSTITCLSGLNGSGKSSLLGQIILDICQQNKKVALFSGEMPAPHVMSWLHLQACGSAFVKETQYEGVFRPDDFTIPLINKWLYDKLFLYNHEVTRTARKFENILESMKLCVNQGHTDVIILDNLAAIDLGATQFNKNEKQSAFIWSLKDFATEYETPIIFVAHPRKAAGFLRKEDISGTADLTNAADNVFIVHRVNNDFRRLTEQMFRWPKDHDIYDFDNVVEVCKNRSLQGMQDYMVGIHFCKKSKRMQTNTHLKSYDWERLMDV